MHPSTILAPQYGTYEADIDFYFQLVYSASSASPCFNTPHTVYVVHELIDKDIFTGADLIQATQSIAFDIAAATSTITNNTSSLTFNFNAVGSKFTLNQGYKFRTRILSVPSASNASFIYKSF